MDVIYSGDIPKDYKYARFGNYYIDLFKQPNLQGELDYYRIYLYDNLFEYDHLFQTFNQYNYSTAKQVEVTDDFHYRRDLPSICFLSIVEICVILIIFNLVTSVFKKGGLLHGLL